MSDERGRRRDTPTGMGPGRAGAGQAPRGAGLSGNLPSGSRGAKDKHETPTGLAPVSVQHEPPVRSKPLAYPAQAAPRAHESSEGGPWDSVATPARPVSVEPRAMRSPPPPRPPTARSVADGFATTHPAEAPVPPHPTSRAVQAAHPGARPLEPHKPSLRLKLDADPDYEGRAVRVPKRRAPLLIGVFLLLGMLAGGSLLWIDAHGGVDNFVAQLKHLADPSSPAPVSGTLQPPPTATEKQQPGAAATPPPTAAPTTPAAEAAAPPAAPAEAKPQVATGEIEESPPAESASPQPAAAAPKPPARPAPAARPSVPREPVVKRPPVHRDPVIRIQPLGDVLRAAPPDPSGREVLPPPDPPAPE